MKHLAAYIAVAVLCTGCAKTTGTLEGSRGVDSGRYTDVGSGSDSKMGVVTAKVSLRSDGSRLFLLNRGKATCTAVFDEGPEADSSELSPINCTDGNNGDATMVYGSDGRASRVVYNAGLDGGGTITF